MRTIDSFFKVLLGIGIAVLVFMSWMLAEQRGWINTDISGTILSKVDSGKSNALAEAEQAKKKSENSEKTDSGDDFFEEEETTEEPAVAAEPEKTEEEPSATEEKAEEPSDSTETTDEETPAETEEEASDDAAEGSTEKSEPEPAPAVKKSSNKLDYTTASQKPNTWPKAVIVTAKGTQIPLFDSKGNKIGTTNLPVGTRLFVKKLSSSGVLTVEGESLRQVFDIHASRTNFRKLYTGKPIQTATPGSSGEPSSTSSDDSQSDGESESESDSESGSKSSSSDDDFFDEDF